MTPEEWAVQVEVVEEMIGDPRDPSRYIDHAGGRLVRVDVGAQGQAAERWPFVALRHPHKAGLRRVGGGVPIALKANMCVEGVESNCASRILAGYRAPGVQEVLEVVYVHKRAFYLGKLKIFYIG